MLPAVLIHGDLIKGNVLIPEPSMLRAEPAAPQSRLPRSAQGWEIVDFAVANRLPRVQELAVIAANLCHGAPNRCRNGRT